MKLLIATSFCAALLAGDIQWKTDWNASTVEAIKAQKLIFLVIDHPKGGC